jgi:NADH:ubiquinone oxidoreductase subunit 3 (subunit A)
MFLRRRFPNVLSVLMIIGGLFVSLFILRKMKYLYDSNQKYHRLESYKQYVSNVNITFNMYYYLVITVFFYLL